MFANLVDIKLGKIEDIVEKCEDSKLYLSREAMRGILRRNENSNRLNKRLKEIMERSIAGDG